jgi:hypothetical protein
MTWNETSTCVNCDIDGVAKLAAADVPRLIVQEDTPWKTQADNMTCTGFFGATGKSPNWTCGNTTTDDCHLLLKLPGAYSMDHSQYDCYEMAMSDPRCGRHVFWRKFARSQFHDCMCWRGDGGDMPCCGACEPNSERAKDWMLYTIK